MNLYDTDFDPLKALQTIHDNQIVLHNAHQTLMKKVNEQDQLIDSLLKSVELSNKANELLLNQLAYQINFALEKINDKTSDN
jgi:hypothetical protein